MKRGVLVLGEVLCDLFPPAAGISFVDATSYVPLLGGAPANVAVQLARKGVDTALVTAVGADPLGERLARELAREGVDTRGVVVRRGWRTGVTLVELEKNGERRFFPLADKRADLSLGADDVDARVVKRFACVHTGTVGLRATTPLRAHKKLAEVAHAAGAMVSLDVNLRFGMYPTRAHLLSRARAALRRADIVKATRDEAHAVVDDTSLGDDELLAELLARGPKLAMLTLDKDGAILATRRARTWVKAPRVVVKDATGAGDAFMGAALARLLDLGVSRNDLRGLDERALADVGAAACEAGSAACTALGATTAMLRSRPVRPRRRVS